MAWQLSLLPLQIGIIDQASAASGWQATQSSTSIALDAAQSLTEGQQTTRMTALSGFPSRLFEPAVLFCHVPFRCC